MFFLIWCMIQHLLFTDCWALNRFLLSGRKVSTIRYSAQVCSTNTPDQQTTRSSKCVLILPRLETPPPNVAWIQPNPKLLTSSHINQNAKSTPFLLPYKTSKEQLLWSTWEKHEPAGLCSILLSKHFVKDNSYLILCISAHTAIWLRACFKWRWYDSQVDKKKPQWDTIFTGIVPVCSHTIHLTPATHDSQCQWFCCGCQSVTCRSFIMDMLGWHQT